MNRPDLHFRAEEAAVAIRSAAAVVPETAIVLGSGLGAIVGAMDEPESIPYGRIPHFSYTTVAGHHGHLVFGSLGGVKVAVLEGRCHAYEGYDPAEVTFPIRVLQVLGVRTLILTSSTGGVRETLRPGEIVCLSDHLNLTGTNPLRGPNDDRLGPRFPDMTEVYSSRLRGLALEEAGRLGIPMTTGVYACVPGPSYETPAEVRMLRTLGADVVGMSTVPEAIVARHAGLEVLAFALVSNLAAGLGTTPITHVEVLEMGRSVGPRLAGLIGNVLGRLVG